jgi:hypothetical protein
MVPHLEESGGEPLIHFDECSLPCRFQIPGKEKRPLTRF